MLSAEPVPKFLWSGKFPLSRLLLRGQLDLPSTSWKISTLALAMNNSTILYRFSRCIFHTSMVSIFSLPYYGFCPIMFLPSQTWFTYGLLGIPLFSFHCCLDNLHSQYQISEKNSLLWQPVSDGIEIYFQTRQVHRSVSLQTGFPWVRWWLSVCCLSLTPALLRSALCRPWGWKPANDSPKLRHQLVSYYVVNMGGRGRKASGGTKTQSSCKNVDLTGRQLR